MTNTMYGFVLTTIAGLSTLLGIIPIFIKKQKNNKIIAGALAFASGVMITVTIIDLLPESFFSISTTFHFFPTLLLCAIFFIIGIILSISIDKYLPTGTNENGLYRVGIISMLAIILHNIPEGIATFLATDTNKALGISLTIAIALHNIPEGISISIPIYYATNNRKKAFLYTLISGLSEPLGAILACLFLKPFVTDFIMGILVASIGGIMFHIATQELLPTSKNYHFKRVTLFLFITGCLFMLIGHFLVM